MQSHIVKLTLAKAMATERVKVGGGGEGGGTIRGHIKVLSAAWMSEIRATTWKVFFLPTGGVTANSHYNSAAYL